MNKLITGKILAWKTKNEIIRQIWWYVMRILYITIFIIKKYPDNVLLRHKNSKSNAAYYS